MTYLSNLHHTLKGGHPTHGVPAIGLDDIPHIYMYYMRTDMTMNNVSVYME